MIDNVKEYNLVKRTIRIPNIFNTDKELHIGIFFASLKVFLSISAIFPSLSFIDTLLSVVAALMFMICIVNERYSIKTLVIYAIVTFLCMLTSINVGNLGILLTVLTCLAVVKRNFNKAIECMFVCELTFGIVNVLFSLVYSLFGNSSFFMDVEGVKRFTFGFSHPNIFSIYLFNLVLMWIWLNFGHITKKNMLIIIFFEILAYSGAKTRTAVLNMIILIVLLFLGSRMTKKHFVLTTLAKYITPVCAIFTYIVTYFYTTGNHFIRILDDFLSYRIRLGAYILNNFGVTLIGQPISDKSVVWDPYWQLTEFTFDNIYTYFISSIGIVWLILICIIFYKLAKKKNVKINICIILWALYGITEVQGINAYILFPLVLSALIFDKSKNVKAPIS